MSKSAGGTKASRPQNTVNNVGGMKINTTSISSLQTSRELLNALDVYNNHIQISSGRETITIDVVSKTDNGIKFKAKMENIGRYSDTIEVPTSYIHTSPQNALNKIIEIYIESKYR